MRKTDLLWGIVFAVILTYAVPSLAKTRCLEYTEAVLLDVYVTENAAACYDEVSRNDFFFSPTDQCIEKIGAHCEYDDTHEEGITEVDYILPHQSAPWFSCVTEYRIPCHCDCSSIKPSASPSPAPKKP